MNKKDKKNEDNTLIRNKKAFHDYHILETYEAGIELRGTEVKSCRSRSISLADSFAKVVNGEVYLYNVHISPYDFGNRFNHESRRSRRLLLHKREILKLWQRIREEGQTLIPLAFYLKRGKVKVSLGVAKGKKLYDKRESLKKRQDKIEASRVLAKM